MSNSTTADPRATLERADRTALWACSGWALLSLGLFVVFGGLFLGDRPDWFSLLASLLKTGAFLIATALCWRNATEPDSLSGRSVWQAIAAGMTFYALGDITAMLWRSLWGFTSAASLGDVFYGASYLFLAIGLSQAVLTRQINLNIRQALGIAIAGILGIVLAGWLNFYAPSWNDTASDAISAETQAVSIAAKSTTTGAISGSGQQAPELVRVIDQRLSRVSKHLGLVYVAGDCILVLMAVTLLMAFWGGTYSEAWKLIALAGICLYVADMFSIYYVGQGNYRQGASSEIFWILSALLFGLGAGVEYGISHQMRQQRAPKRWI